MLWGGGPGPQDSDAVGWGPGSDAVGWRGPGSHINQLAESGTINRLKAQNIKASFKKALKLQQEIGAFLDTAEIRVLFT